VDGDSSPDSYLSATPEKMVNGAGLAEAIPDGDTVAHALTVNHSFGGGFADSWVSNGHSPDYFAVAAPPTIVLDLGSEQTVGTIILWQYENSGGSNSTDGARDGNDTLTMNIRFNTEAEGSSSFTGSSTTITMKEVWLGLGGVNSAQAFALPTPTARYVQLEVTDNYYGQPNIVAGGDRVGIGEVRFATEAVPEPSSALLGALGLLGLLRRRR
jgi:MYXO-CTERM domain-containing protein